MTALSQSELLLMALARLEQRKRTLATVAELTVEAWRATPRAWRLSGFDLPDNNRVIAALCGKRGPIRRGWMNRPIPGLAVVRLTDAGRKAVRAIERKLAVMEDAA